jgi:hypothetical protein
MSEPIAAPEPYRVSYSQQVRESLERLIVRERQLGRGRQLLDALKAIDYRLRIYPQFGQPLRDLKLEPAKVWIGCVPPLVVQYILDEERRVVLVVTPILPLR